MRSVQCDAVMTIDTQWFTDRLAERQLSQRGLAKLMGIDPSAISLMLRDKRRMTLEEAAQIAVLLNSSTDEVLRAAGVEPPGSANKIRIIGHVRGDSSVGLEAEGIHDLVDAPPGLPADAVAIQARTARSELDMLDGWLYFLSENQMRPEKAIGTYALVAIKNNGLSLKHVSKGYRSGTYNLSDRNGNTMQNVELAWASPILWIKTNT